MPLVISGSQCAISIFQISMLSNACPGFYFNLFFDFQFTIFEVIWLQHLKNVGFSINLELSFKGHCYTCNMANLPSIWKLR